MGLVILRVRICVPRISLASLLLAALVSGPLQQASAQVVTDIVTDGTVGPARDVGLIDGYYTIGEDLGSRPNGGPNLFHSFERFNVAAGEVARFTAGPLAGIHNVISRVTGGVRSDIYGTLRSEIPGADFYFFNPAGVVFGPESTLDLSGSLFVSTAHELRDENGVAFAAIDPAPVLDFGSPDAFGFLGDSGGIQILSGSQALAVDSGATLAFIGQGITIGETDGDPAMGGRELRAPGGLIDLVSVAGAGEVPVVGRSQSDLADFTALGRIELLPGALLHAPEGGNVVMRGEDILLDGVEAVGGEGQTVAGVVATNDGPGEGGGIDIAARRYLLLSDAVLNSANTGDGHSTGILLEAPLIEIIEQSHVGTLSAGAGSSGDVAIRANELILELRGEREGASDFSVILSDASDGTAGDLRFTVARPDKPTQIVVDDRVVELTGEFSIGNHGIVEALSSETGVGGSIVVDVNGLEVFGGGDLRTIANGKLNPGGALLIDAAEYVRVTGRDGDSDRSSIETKTEAPAAGGRLEITTPLLEIADGGEVLSFTDFDGGPAGDIEIRAGRIEIGSEGEITSKTQTASDAGDVSLTADESIHIVGSGLANDPGTEEEPRFPTGIFSRTQSEIGSAGNLSIETPELLLDAGAAISTLGAIGNAGDVSVIADRVVVAGGSVIDSTSVTLGYGGDIDIRASEFLRVEGTDEAGRPSRVGALTFGRRDAGDVTITTPALTVDGGLITTSTLGLADLPLDLGFPPDSPGVIKISKITFGGFELAVEIKVTIKSKTVTTLRDLQNLTLGEFEDPDLTVDVIDSGLLSGLLPKNSVKEILEAELPKLKMIDLFGDETAALIAELVVEDGSAGTIEIDAGSVRVIGGGEIDASSYSRGSAGTITLNSGDLLVSGPGSGIFNRPGPAGTGGGVEIAAGRILVSDGGRIAIDGGEDALDLSRFLSAIRDNFLSDLTSFPAARAAPFDEAVSVGEAEARLGGTITADVAVDIPSVVDAADLLANRDPDATAEVGTLRIQAGELFVEEGGSITADAVDASGGNVDIEANTALVLRDGSLISASAADTGGNVGIETAALVVIEGSRIEASASEGDGGAITVEAEAVFRDLDIPIEETFAAFGGSQGTDGTVSISSPDVDIESQVNPLETPYVDASSQLRPLCSARAAGGIGGSFTVARRRGLRSTPEDLLLASDVFGPRSPVSEAVKAAAKRPSVPPEAVPPEPAAEAPLVAASASFERGAKAFRGGHYDAAADQLKQASQLYATGGDVPARGDALRGLGESQQALGEYAASIANLQLAVGLARAAGDGTREAASLGALGNAYLALGDGATAETHLTRGVALAQEAGDHGSAATLLNNLGNLRASQRDYAPALRAYRESAAAAAAGKQPTAEARALTSAGRAALELGDGTRAAELLARAEQQLAALSPTRQKAAIEIHLARSRSRMAELAPAQRDASLRAAHGALTEAIAVASEIEDSLLHSYALGNLGGLYEQEGREEEALYLTRRAVGAADAADAPEALYRWHWQEGRLLWARGRANAAIAAYRRAVAILEEMRPETRAQYASAELRFRRSVAPVYRDLVEALLEGSDLVTSRADSTRLLVEARATMEQLKAAELRDYYRDECVAEVESKQRGLETIAANAAVVYPILLPERLELLVSLPSGIERHTLPVGAEEITRTVEAFRRGLVNRTSFAYREPAERLYDWLVRPYESRLEAEAVATLVFVPDGVLRTVPMAALHDGERHLVERYSLAVTPGLSLVDPQPLDTQGAKLLLAGLSEPVEGFDALPNAAREIEAIRALFGGKVLLDESFETQRFTSELASQEPSVVHVASHAVFTGDPATSFLLTHDGRLTMDAITQAVAPTQFRRQPLELLVLSACETAVGDERAALGLAGVAIRAGARSAFGSLWRIQDEAAYEVVVAFYEELKNSQVSKAEALRRAQQRLLANRAFSHPFYWSPFLIISNWL